jgi:ubiquinone/menaquinone biosynthesis C-methylase UbiE
MGQGSAARSAYDAFASAYDLFTADFAHERWLAAIEALAREHGLSGRRVLDVACGTGKSFLPLLGRGYDVTACDISPAMLARAASKAPGVRVVAGDMRRLPDLGEFDLVTCLDDALNYVTSEDDLIATFRGFRRCMASNGLAVWDVNTQAMYRVAFARTWAVEDERRLVLWRGGTGEAFAPGDVACARIDIFELGVSGWTRTESRHDQRHWPAAAVAEAAHAAGLAVVCVRGQLRGARLERELDEEVHPKALFLACRDDRPAARSPSRAVTISPSRALPGLP